jgi:hypothetical protein
MDEAQKPSGCVSRTVVRTLNILLIQTVRLTHVSVRGDEVVCFLQDSLPKFCTALPVPNTCHHPRFYHSTIWKDVQIEKYYSGPVVYCLFKLSDPYIPKNHRRL